MGKRITKVEQFIRWCQNHKLISILVIVGLVIIALGNFTRALEAIYGFLKSSSSQISISNTSTSSESQTKAPVSPSIADNTQTTNNPTLTQEPSKILDEINAARPMQQEAIEKSFIGAKVRWLLKLNSVEPYGDPIRDETLIVFIDGKNSVVACIRISDEDKNLLRLSEKGALFYVAGTISDCNLTSVTLSDCKLTPDSPDKNIK